MGYISIADGETDAGFHIIACTIAEDKNVPSSKIVCGHNRRIANNRKVCFLMIADYRRTVCNLRFAVVYDHWKPGLMCYTVLITDSC